ncbi:MAG: response regulator, partial [Planctomycetes bacterium]|nr:response regulator [Planctomycetota bacterium]
MAGEKKKLLVVDDDPVAITVIRAQLSSQPWETQYFTHPLEALEVLQLESFDVILSDLCMPEMNGLEFLAKASDLYPQVVKLMLTADSSPESIVKAIEEGNVLNYLCKPWKSEQLIASLYSAFRYADALKRNDLLIHKLQDNSFLLKQEIDTHKLTERKLNSLQKQLANILEAASPICVVSLEDSILLVNESFIKLFELKKSGIEGTPLNQIPALTALACDNHKERNERPMGVELLEMEYDFVAVSGQV